MKHLPTLPHPLEDWLEIKVTLIGGRGSIFGICIPSGEKWKRGFHIGFFPEKEAIETGQHIAEMVSATRLLCSLPRCNFTVETDPS